MIKKSMKTKSMNYYLKWMIYINMKSCVEFERETKWNIMTNNEKIILLQCETELLNCEGKQVYNNVGKPIVHWYKYIFILYSELKYVTKLMIVWWYETHIVFCIGI